MTDPRADFAFEPTDPGRAAPRAATTAGQVEGFWRPTAEGGVASAAFLGIPFAAAPVGDLRFSAPAPPEPWDGVRPATTYGATPQKRPFGPDFTPQEPSYPGDAILNVDVFTPVPGDRAARLPVLVFIHGGGYFAGSPASPWTDGRAFNRDGIVTVSVSYRLGFDGFGVIDGAPNNRGILDQIAALRWVRGNIAGFGGDPDKVTIAGQSAGGGSVVTLLSSPAADGYFRSGIIQSGAFAEMTPARARAKTAAMAAQLGLTAPTLADWRRVDPDAILDVERTPPPDAGDDPDLAVLIRRAVRPAESSMALPFLPVVDGETLLGERESVTAGRHAETPLLLGTVADEIAGKGEPVPVEVLAARFAAAGASAAGVEQYRGEVDRLGQGYEFGQAATHVAFRLPMIGYAAARAIAGAGARTWLYDFRYPSPLTGAATHCSDIVFAWDLLHADGAAANLGPDPNQEVADRMHADWVRFVTDGRLPWAGVDQGVAGAEVYTAEGAAYDASAYRLEVDLTVASEDQGRPTEG